MSGDEEIFIFKVSMLFAKNIFYDSSLTFVFDIFCQKKGKPAVVAATAVPASAATVPADKAKAGDKKAAKKGKINK